MSTIYKCLRVFLCTASGTATEEAAVKAAIEQLNRGTRPQLGIEFELLSWQDLAPRAPDLAVGRKQAEINEFVKSCDIFILILWKRHGSFEPDQNRTNLEREVDEAVARLKHGSNMIMLSYFRNFMVSPAPNDQERGVMTLRQRLHEAGIFYNTYHNPAKFSARIVPDLYESLLKLEFDTPKHRAMRNFWKFGLAERPPRKKLLIAYPGMDRAYMRLPDKDNELWIRRLVPNIVYEDHRALNKIEKILRLIGMSDFHTCTIANLPDDWRYMNQCWVCIPRNRIALERLKRHAGASQFKVIVPGANSEASFFWRKPASSKSIHIKSPLEVYLRLQRKEPALSGEWGRELRDVVARDFAVIARFPVSDNQIQMHEGTQMEYFIGGIRGLGTWGAAWFLDRQWSAFEKCRGFEPFQRLLEITYANGRIAIARDVSEESIGYFQRQMEREFILKTIEEYKEGMFDTSFYPNQSHNELHDDAVTAPS
jgi:hypothetical protein